MCVIVWVFVGKYFWMCCVSKDGREARLVVANLSTCSGSGLKHAGGHFRGWWENHVEMRHHKTIKRECFHLMHRYNTTCVWIYIYMYIYKYYIHIKKDMFPTFGLFFWYLNWHSLRLIVMFPIRRAILSGQDATDCIRLSSSSTGTIYWCM